MTQNNIKQTTAGTSETVKMERSIGLRGLIVFGIAYFMPLAFVGSLGIISVTSYGNTVVAILIAGIAMLFTAFSYRQMVAAYPYSGSAYIYASRSMNPYIGFVTGWGILMDYMMLPLSNCVVVPIFCYALLPAIPKFGWMVIFIALITIPNIFGIKITQVVNYTLLIMQIIVTVVTITYIVNYVTDGGGSGTLMHMHTFINIDAFMDNGFGGVITAASMFCINFIGFDAVTTIAEEAKNPVKDLRRAVLIIVIFAIVFFAVFCYLFMLVWPDAWMEMTDTDTMTYQLARIIGGAFLVNLIGITYNLAQLATNASSMAAGSRIFYAMGRDGILPKKFFGHLSKNGTPVYNVLLIAAICFLGVFLDLNTAVSMVSFGALFGFTMVNISVIAHFWVKEKKRQGTDVIKYLILPIIAAAITATLVIMLSTPAKIVGCSWLAIGIIYLAIRTKGFREEPPQMDFSEAE